MTEEILYELQEILNHKGDVEELLFQYIFKNWEELEKIKK